MAMFLLKITTRILVKSSSHSLDKATLKAAHYAHILSYVRDCASPHPHNRRSVSVSVWFL